MKTKLCVLLFLLSLQSYACVIPVFRYALERWPSEPYRAFVLYKDSLTNADSAVVLKLQDAPNSHANMDLIRIDLNAPDSINPFKNDWVKYKCPSYPWLVVEYPVSSLRTYTPVETITVWEGSLSDPAISTLLSSPIRKEIPRRIKSGETAVLVLLQSGDKKKDTEAANGLKKIIEELNSKLTLPQIPPQSLPQWFNPMRGPELKVHFSFVTLSRTDKSEQMFLQMLYKSSPLDTSSNPVIYAVFGQGRCLPVTTFDKNHDKTITSVCRFLTGMCSCEVKEMNPGFDLLLTTNWYDRPKLSHPIIDMEPKTPTQLTGLTGSQPKIVTKVKKDTTNTINCKLSKHPDTIVDSTLVQKTTSAAQTETPALSIDSSLSSNDSSIVKNPSVPTSKSPLKTLSITIIALLAVIIAGSLIIMRKKNGPGKR